MALDVLLTLCNTYALNASVLKAQHSGRNYPFSAQTGTPFQYCPSPGTGGQNIRN